MQVSTDSLQMYYSITRAYYSPCRFVSCYWSVNKLLGHTANHTGWEHNGLYNNPILFLFGLNLMSSTQRYGWTVSINFSTPTSCSSVYIKSGSWQKSQDQIYFESTRMRVWVVLVLLFCTFAVSAAQSKCNPLLIAQLCTFIKVHFEQRKST